MYDHLYVMKKSFPNSIDDIVVFQRVNYSYDMFLAFFLYNGIKIN